MRSRHVSSADVDTLNVVLPLVPQKGQLSPTETIFFQRSCSDFEICSIIDQAKFSPRECAEIVRNNGVRVRASAMRFIEEVNTARTTDVRHPTSSR